VRVPTTPHRARRDVCLVTVRGLQIVSQLFQIVFFFFSIDGNKKGNVARAIVDSPFDATTAVYRACLQVCVCVCVCVRSNCIVWNMYLFIIIFE